MTLTLIFDFLVKGLVGGVRHGVVWGVHHLAFEGLWHFSVEVHFFGDFLVEHVVVHLVVHHLLFSVWKVFLVVHGWGNQFLFLEGKEFLLDGQRVVHHLLLSEGKEFLLVHGWGNQFLFLEGKEFLLLSQKLTVVHGWGDEFLSLEEFLQQHFLQEHVLSETVLVVHGWVGEFLLSVDLEHTGRSVAAEDFVFFSHGESDFLKDHLLKEFFLDKFVLDEVVLVEGILDKVILVEGILNQILLKFFLHQVLLDFVLDEFLLDFFLDESVNWENTGDTADLSIDDLDGIVVDLWLSGDGIDDLSLNILWHNFNVSDNFSNWGLGLEEITVDFLDQVLLVDIVDIETLFLSVHLGGWVEGLSTTFDINESVLVQSLDSTEVIVEVGVVDWADEFAVDSTDFSLYLQSLDLWVDVLVEEDWVSEVLLELTGGEEESLEEWRRDILLEDWVFQVFSEQRNVHVFSEQFSVVEFSDGEDGGKVTSHTLHWKVNTLHVQFSGG